MNPEEKQKYVQELAQQGYAAAERANLLFDELAVKMDSLKKESKILKEELTTQLVVSVKL